MILDTCQWDLGWLIISHCGSVAVTNFRSKNLVAINSCCFAQGMIITLLSYSTVAPLLKFYVFNSNSRRFIA